MTLFGVSNQPTGRHPPASGGARGRSGFKVFVIQNMPNPDARALNLKLDELLHGVKGARARLACSRLSEIGADSFQTPTDDKGRVWP